MGGRSWLPAATASSRTMTIDPIMRALLSSSTAPAVTSMWSKTPVRYPDHRKPGSIRLHPACREIDRIDARGCELLRGSS
jgi:hypothetical protein